MHRPSVILAILALTACRPGKPGGGAQPDTSGFVSLAPGAPLDSTLRIVVTDQFQVYADGRPVSLTELDSLLARLKTIEGEVWFYRQPVDIQVIARQDTLIDSVLDAVHRHELAFRSSRMADFADLVGKPRSSAGAEGP